MEKYYFVSLVYFDRYRNTKIAQFQAADDQFFLPDSEVTYSKNFKKKLIESYLGIFLG